LTELHHMRPPDWRERELISSLLEVNLLVEAAAGTGKTTQLVNRMVALVRAGACRLDQMAALTFTRKAASELRTRFQEELQKQARAGGESASLRRALEQLERCFIGTIHSFCARLLRERPVEAGVDPSFQEIDDELDRNLREQAWEEYLASLYAQDAPILGELEELSIEVGRLKEAFITLCDYPDVEHWPAPKLKKPDVQNYRRALLEYAAHMEALTESLPDDPGNDKLIPKYQLIPRLIRQSDLGSLPQLAEVFQAFTSPKDMSIVQRNWRPLDKEQAEKELQRWERFRQQWAEPFLEQWRTFCYEPLLRAVRPAISVYERLRRQSGMLSYGDLLVKACRLLREAPNVRKYFSRRFSRILVDEFQDTDPLQAEVLLLLASEDPTETDWRRCRPRPGSIFVVGDPKQSIYRFRRADIVTYNQVKEIILRHGGRVVRLSANFRAEGELIQWVNKTFQEKFTAGKYSPEYVPLEAAKGGGGDPGKNHRVRRLLIKSAYKNKRAIREFEPAFVAGWIRRVLDGEIPLPLGSGHGQSARPEDFMIITYRREGLGEFAAELQKLGIPHQVTGSAALSQVSQLRLLYLCLAAVVRPEDPVALVACLRSELFGLSDQQLYAFRRAGGVFSYSEDLPCGLPAELKGVFEESWARLRKYAGWLRKFPMLAAVERIAQDSGLLAWAAAQPGGNVRAGSLAKAIELLRSRQPASRTLAEMVEFLGRVVRGENLGELSFDSLPAAPGEGYGVRLMNLHKAKGLEAPVVFLADPFGLKKRREVKVHIDRSQGKTTGYPQCRSRWSPYH